MEEKKNVKISKKVHKIAKVLAANEEKDIYQIVELAIIELANKKKVERYEF